MHHSQTHSIAAALACLTALTFTAGCTAGKSDDWKFSRAIPTSLPWSKDKPAPPQVPARMVTSWTHTVLHRAGESPQRGFGGRLLFFGRESDEPVRVAGQLVVYAFDETDRAKHDSQPTRRYIYPADQFARLESDNKLGASYSVWLPWDEVGGVQKNVSLIARFEPTDGPLILGEQTRHLLPGTTLETPTAPSPQIQLASHEAAEEAVDSAAKPPLGEETTPRGRYEVHGALKSRQEAESGMRTTSIPLIRRLATP